MNALFVHIADLHFVRDRAEDFGVVLEAFLADLSTQLDARKGSGAYLVMSGDVVQGGGVAADYEALLEKLDARLTSVGIPRSRRICVPGNHDISQQAVMMELATHEGWLSQAMSEREFNDFAQKENSLVSDKFAHYRKFESDFAAYGLGTRSTGAGWDIGEGVGVYCLNTAVMSLGGATRREADRRASDQKRLLVETRGLHNWLQGSAFKHRILVMHHPEAWLCEWSERELRTVMDKSFSVSFSGHVHRQKAAQRFYRDRRLVECGAPPLFSRKTDLLGYSFLSLSTETGARCIEYRQSTPRQTFVTGVSFSDTDDGKVNCAVGCLAATEDGPDSAFERTRAILSKRLEEALEVFPEQPRVWLEPKLSERPETAVDADRGQTTTPQQLVDSPRNAVVHAPPQFGLTCLAHHIAKLAWQPASQRLWIRLDAQDLKPHANTIAKAVKRELVELGSSDDKLAGVILDSWSTEDPAAFRLLSKVREALPEKPVLVMHTLSPGSLVPLGEREEMRDFHHLHLWSLSRGGVREVVRMYNDSRPLGDEDAVTSRLSSDCVALNLHRTPLNCITLMKVHESDFDESPVNRTEVIKRVLFLLFNMGHLPTYKTRPDVKDCEYVLGYFCEQLVRRSVSVFTRDEFVKVSKGLCAEQYIDLDVDVVFDVLVRNHVLMQRGSDAFGFRFAYWLYYFCAQRMHRSPEFAAYVLKDHAYARFPEVMEFYTGIDRSREDAIQQLIRDLRASRERVQAKCGFPAEVNLYESARWNPGQEASRDMERELREGIKESNLPVSVKDKVADLSYDRSRPYNQEIRLVIPEWSLPMLTNTLSAAGRALRNSDYVRPDVKAELLDEIAESWSELCRVLWVLAPWLAGQGRAVFEGTAFELGSGFSDRPEERLIQILTAVPQNIVDWSQDDLLSQKMGPLLLHYLKKEKDGLRRHLLALLLVRHRPRGWHDAVQEYAMGCDKSSYYLYDLLASLRAQYRYSFASPRTLEEMAFLIKLVVARHQGLASSSPKKVNQVSNSVLPPRELDGGAAEDQATAS